MPMTFPYRMALALGFFLAASGTSSAQEQEQEQGLVNRVRRYVERIIGEGEDPTAPKFINYPTLAYTPETSWEFGISSLYVYSAKRDLSNRLSEIKAFTFYTLEKQYGISLDHALYTDRNRWFFYGRVQGQSFPLFYHGTGRDAPTKVQSVVEGQYLQLRERILREAWPSVYVGLELNYQTLNRVRYVDSTPEFTTPEVGAAGSNNLGLGLGILYNDIHNAMNPREGRYSEWAFLNYGSGLGSDFTFTSWIIDNRVYLPVGGNSVLAAQVYGEFTGGNPPFNMLALMGGQSLMRGYYLGRYRDRNLLAGQVEYRILPFPFSKRIGASVFLATGQVYGDDHAFSWQQFLPTGGAGGRFLLFPDKDIYTRLDVAFTREGRGYYFSIGEAF
jgi:hypothetical protein